MMANEWSEDSEKNWIKILRKKEIPFLNWMGTFTARDMNWAISQQFYSTQNTENFFVTFYPVLTV